MHDKSPIKCDKYAPRPPLDPFPEAAQQMRYKVGENDTKSAEQTKGDNA